LVVWREPILLEQQTTDFPLCKEGLREIFVPLVNPSKSPFIKGDFKAGTAKPPSLKKRD
jgi:hypothetical protein